MYYKCELVVGGYSYNVTDNLVNWDDVEMSFKRNDYDGVVRSFSTKFQFSNGAYSLLMSEFLKNYLKSSASVIFYTRNNSWLWDEKFRCALDFSTFTDNGTTCEINAIDDSLASIIKAKKGTQYEYPVSEIKENAQLNYDRIQMTSKIEWIPTGTTDDDGNMSNTFKHNSDFEGGTGFGFPLYIKGTPEIAVKNIIEVYDDEIGEGVDDNIRSTGMFFKNISNHGIKVNIRLYLEFSASLQKSAQVNMRLDQQGTVTDFLKHASITEGKNIWDFSVDGYLVFGNGGFLRLQLVTTYNGVTITQTPEEASASYMTIDFVERDNSINIDVVRPSTILNRLLSSMTGSADVVGEIASGIDERLDNTLILPAESIRGIENAKLYTSYTKFANWMNAEFGFVPVIGGNKVSFVHRDSLFQDKEVKNLGSQSVDFEYSVNSSLIYSRLKVGYDKQDYDSVNGRDEFRFGVAYTTGTTLTDNSLELVSPYRADVYGIEFLAAKRGEDTTDSDSDNDVFIVGASLDNSTQKFVLIRGGKYAISGVISPETMFNVMYAQRFMIEANQKYIGAFSSLLEFASSEGNGDTIINGVSVADNIEISDRYFTVGELSVETNDLGVPEDLTGYIALQKNGRTYKGYIKSSSYNYGKPEAVKYSLIVKSIE